MVCACDPVAAAAGIAPGMALNSALACCRSCRCWPAIRGANASCSRRSRNGPVRFTPARQPRAAGCGAARSPRQPAAVRRLAPALRHGCARNCARPGSSRSSRSRRHRWPRSGWHAPGESGPSVSREDLASRLARLPLACTRWPERSLETLATMGVRTVGDCLRLPRDGFARRFEPRMLDMLDRAVGRRPDPRDGFVPRERFAAGRDLEPEIAETARLDAAVAPLLDELCAFLREASMQRAGTRAAARAS